MSEKQFLLPVDSEHKALKINLLSFAAPHMRAFHLCWMGFFSSFVSTFAPAAMIPVIREAINLDAGSLGNAGEHLCCCVVRWRAYPVPGRSREAVVCPPVHLRPTPVVGATFVARASSAVCVTHGCRLLAHYGVFVMCLGALVPDVRRGSGLAAPWRSPRMPGAAPQHCSPARTLRAQAARTICFNCLCVYYFGGSGAVGDGSVLVGAPVLRP